MKLPYHVGQLPSRKQLQQQRARRARHRPQEPSRSSLPAPSYEPLSHPAQPLHNIAMSLPYYYSPAQQCRGIWACSSCSWWTCRWQHHRKGCNLLCHVDALCSGLDPGPCEMWCRAQRPWTCTAGEGSIAAACRQGRAGSRASPKPCGPRRLSSHASCCAALERS